MLTPADTTISRSAMTAVRIEQPTRTKPRHNRKKDILPLLKRWWSLIVCVVFFIIRAIPLIIDPAGIMSHELAMLALKMFGLQLLGYVLRKVVKKK